MTMLFWILHFPHTCVMPCMVHWISLKGLWIVVGSCSAGVLHNVFCSYCYTVLYYDIKYTNDYKIKLISLKQSWINIWNIPFFGNPSGIFSESLYFF